MRAATRSSSCSASSGSTPGFVTKVTRKLAGELPVNRSTAASSATTPGGHERAQEVGSEHQGNGNELARLDFGQQEAALIPPKPQHVDEEDQTDIAEHAIDLGQHRAMRQLPLPQTGGGIQEQWGHDDEVGHNGQQPREALPGAADPLTQSRRDGEARVRYRT